VLAEWDKGNPDTVYDADIFQREILPPLAGVKLAEIELPCAVSGDLANTRGVPSPSTKRGRDDDHSRAARR
jgi:hypothetical protein